MVAPGTARPTVPARTAKHRTALGKANPGARAFGSAGPGQVTHLAGELFNSMAGVQMLHVPYRGSRPAMIGLLAGDAPVMFIPAISAGPPIAAAKLGALAGTGPRRLRGLPRPPAGAGWGGSGAA